MTVRGLNESDLFLLVIEPESDLYQYTGRDGTGPHTARAVAFRSGSKWRTYARSFPITVNPEAEVTLAEIEVRKL